MPHVDSLATEIKDALKLPIPAKSTVELILDPNDLNIDLSQYVDQRAGIRINRKKSIRPYGLTGQYTAGEITLQLLNKDDQFNRHTLDKIFYYHATRLIEDKDSADTYIRVIKGEALWSSTAGGSNKVTVTQGTTTHDYSITSIDTTDPDYDQINFTASGGKAFTAGALVESRYLPGRPVTIKVVLNGVATKVDQFTGILKGHPRLDRQGRAYITLFDDFKTILDIDLKANTYLRLTSSDSGSESSLEYTRAGSSTGEIDLDSVTIVSSKCKIGDWSLKFTSSTEFTLTDTEGNEFSGDTSSTTYGGNAGTSGDHQISIPSGAWSGSFDEDDVIDYQTNCCLGEPVNSWNSLPAMIYRILLEDFGADFTTADLNDSAFQTLITELDEIQGAMTFTSPTTVLKAIELLQQHINGTVFYQNDGKLSISVYWPTYDSGGYDTLSPSVDVMPLATDDLGKVDRVVAEYGWNHTTRKFESRLIIPEGSTDTGNEATLRLPAFHSGNSAAARAAAEHLWLMWRKGVTAYDISELWNYGLALEINDILNISSRHPKFSSREVEVYDVQQDPINKTTRVKAFDLNYSFGHYAFVDKDSTDTGKVCF